MYKLCPMKSASQASIKIPSKVDNHCKRCKYNDFVIIITAAMNDGTISRLLSLLESLVHTKVLLINIVATSFNAENRFYKYLTRINPESQLMSNLLLLTILSDNYRYFLNVAFDDNNGIQMVQNFRQQKLKRNEIKHKGKET